MIRYEKFGRWCSSSLLLLATLGSQGAYPAPSPAETGRPEPPARLEATLNPRQQASVSPNPPAVRIQTLLRFTQTYLSLGKIQQALPYLQEAQHLAQQTRNRAAQSLVLNLFSDIHVLYRQPEQAVTEAESSVKLARQLADQTVLARALNTLGNAYMASGSYSSALAEYQQAFQLNESLSRPALSTQLLINRIHAHLARQEPEKAGLLLQKAQQLTQQPVAHDRQAMDLLAIGHLAQRLMAITPDTANQYQQWAYQAYQTVLKLPEKRQNPRIRSYAYGHLGELYLQAQRFSEAETLTRQALFQAKTAMASELSARWSAQLGQLKQQQGATEDAIHFYQTAIDELETIQPALIYGHRGQADAFHNTTGRIYRELAWLFLQQAEHALNPLQRQTALRHVTRVMESFKRVELKNYFQDDCVTELQERLQHKDLALNLPPGTAVVYPIIFPQRLILLLSLHNQVIQRVDVSVSRQRLRQSISTFRKHLLQNANPRRIRRTGMQLYDWLIQPMEPLLLQHRIDTLVMVPDGILRALPYPALFDGEAFLIQRYALAITAGLSLTDSSKPASQTPQLLVSGLSEAVQDFQPLPHVSREIHGISAHYPGVRVLLDQAFQKTAWRDQLQNKPYTTAVLATHAYLANDPKQSFLLTHDDKLNLDELGQFIGATRFHDQALDLLVLSACDTARGDERAALGLAGMAVKSGASSVLASLWPVNDASTAELIPTFFAQIKNRRSKVKALQQAQQRLINSDLYRHPFYWAGFVLVGNWQ